MRIHCPISLFLFSIMMLSGCSERTESNDYFPLQEGLHWKYNVTEELTDQSRKYVFSIHNMGLSKRHLGINRSLYLRRTSYGTDYYIEKNKKGRFVVGQRRASEQTISEYTNKKLIIPDQSTIHNTKRWKNITHIFALHSNPAYSVSNPQKQAIEMEFSIIARDLEITLPAGTFEQCLHIQGIAEFSFFADPLTGYEDVPITQDEWYCRGIGLVKLIRHEPLNTEMFKGGKIIYELVNLEKT